MSNQKDRYTAEQLEKIRQTLQKSLGDGASAALSNLDQRFISAEEAAKHQPPPDPLADAGRKRGSAATKTIDVAEVIGTGDLEKVMAVLPAVKDEEDLRTMVTAIMKHPESKATHLVAALSRVDTDVGLVEALVEQIVSKKGVNPLIDALKHAAASPKAVRMLAAGIAEQGTVTHMLRAIASSPKDPEAEIVWGMELIGKASIEQIYDAMKLFDVQSPGIVILATGLVNRPGIAAEHLVRPLGTIKDNAQALSIVIARLARMIDVPQVISLMEKYLTDDSEGAEILAVRLIYRCLNTPIRQKEIAGACKYARSDSMMGQLLAVGVIMLGEESEMVRAYERLPAGAMSKKIVGLALMDKVNRLKALSLMGKGSFELQKSASEIQAATRKAKERYHDILVNVLGETPEAK
jgi:hypothetical protein